MSTVGQLLEAAVPKWTVLPRGHPRCAMEDKEKGDMLRGKSRLLSNTLTKKLTSCRYREYSPFLDYERVAHVCSFPLSSFKNGNFYRCHPALAPALWTDIRKLFFSLRLQDQEGFHQTRERGPGLGTGWDFERSLFWEVVRVFRWRANFS